MEKKELFSQTSYIEKIVPIIKENKGIVTPADIALKTGFPIIHIKYILNKLAAKYTADIKVSENGGLLYVFNADLKEKNFKKILKTVIKKILFVFSILFKIMIMLTLLGYMIFYILVIVSFWILFTFSNKKVNSKISGKIIGNTLKLIFEIFVNSVFIFKNPYEKYKEKNKRPFYIKVFSFVFGDDKKEKPFNHDGNILKYLKKFKNITLSQAVSLTGLSELETKNILINMIVKYEGDIEVNDDGIIIYKFDNLEFSNNDSENFSYAWERPKKIPKLNYNTKNENSLIIAFNFFNLLMSSLFMYFFINKGETVTTSNIFRSDVFFLYLYPFIFSTLFFLIPFIRFLKIKHIIPEIEIHNEFLVFLELISNLKKKIFFIESNIVTSKVKEKLFIDFPSLFINDFKDNKEIIDIKNYIDEVSYRI